jgi:hypothetical protein
VGGTTADPAGGFDVNSDQVAQAGLGSLGDLISSKRVQQFAQCSVGCGAEVLGLEDLVDVGLVAAGQPLPGTKRFRTPGSSRGISVAGKAADLAFGKTRIPADKLPRGLPTVVGGPGTGVPLAVKRTRSLARFVGRAVPILGFGLLAIDGIQFGICVAECVSDETSTP